MDYLRGLIQDDPALHKAIFGKDFRQTDKILKKQDAPFADADEDVGGGVGGDFEGIKRFRISGI